MRFFLSRSFKTVGCAHRLQVSFPSFMRDCRLKFTQQEKAPNAPNQKSLKNQPKQKAFYSSITQKKA